jgi:lysophospholipase L1-like esterase
LFLPSQLAIIGHSESKNALLYGWGFKPYETIQVTDPDTGEIYISQANNLGWRDRDRTFTNHKKAYRIVVLGDSNTFGALVPAEKVYTRILEDKLKKNGYNAEVINIAYAGWGTDQQLEALKNEGLKYEPDLVISQFSLNDLSDNTYFLTSDNKRKNQKPFYYTLDKQGNLIRHSNPFFMKNDAQTSQERL